MAKGENPAKRSSRYARELKSGRNELTGKPLTKGQRRFRSGVLNERKWAASIFKHKKANKPKRGKSAGKSKPTFGQDKLPNPDDIHGAYGGSYFPVGDFDYDEYGNIKGHCIGGNLNRFEPD